MSNNIGRPMMLKNARSLTITLEQAQYDELDELSQRARLSISEHVRRAVDNYLDRARDRAAVETLENRR